MQCGKDEMAGLRGGDCGLHRGKIAHFAHEDHVRVLPQGAAQALGKIGDIDADLALVHDAALVVVVILDGVLDGDDVAAFFFVDDIQHARQRVVLPEPVGPVTRMSPRGASMSVRTAGGRPIWSSVINSLGMRRRGHGEVSALAVGTHAETVLTLAESDGEIDAPPRC